jgi:hypothetical protein
LTIAAKERPRRWVWLTLGIFIAATGCRGGPQPPPLAASTTQEPALVYIVARGWHTDVGLDVAAMRGRLRPLAGQFPRARTLFFGFGERDWLLTRQRTPWQLIEAVWPDPAAILVTGLEAPPAVAFADYTVLAAATTESGQARLEAFLADELAITPDASGPQPIAPGPYPGSQFYAATDAYDVLHSCNTWTAEALEAAGLAVRPEGVLFASQVISRSRSAGAEQMPTLRSSPVASGDDRQSASRSD